MSEDQSPAVRRAMAVFESGLRVRYINEFGLPWHVEPWGNGSQRGTNQVNIFSASHETVIAVNLDRAIANWIVAMANAQMESVDL
jgi:hypothetical protein